MTTQAVSVRLDSETFAGLDRLVTELNRSREELIGEALKRYVGDEVAFSEFIEAGERDFENGDFLTHEEFMAQLRAKSARKSAA